MGALENGAPRIALNQLAVEPAEAQGEWMMRWRIANLDSQPLELHALRLPHGQFKSAERRFDPAICLVPDESTEFQALVSCDEPEGLVTENAFLIFRVSRLAEQWRIFVRVRVTVNTKGIPAAETELITTQRAGFSSVAG